MLHRFLFVLQLLWLTPQGKRVENTRSFAPCTYRKLKPVTEILPGGIIVMTSNHYIMRDQVRNRVSSIMECPPHNAALNSAWTTPPAVLSFIAVVLYVTALSTPL